MLSNSKIFNLLDDEDIDETNDELSKSNEQYLQQFFHDNSNGNDILLHILVVGFHHKKGCVVSF